MSRKGIETRERIMDAAQAMILERGFAGVSVDKLIDSLGVTKGAFFHHFKNKSELAINLIERYANSDLQFFHDSLARADKLSNDPLQQVLISVGLYEELFAGYEEPYPGCLLASYIYEIQHFDDSVNDVINNVFLTWREELTRRFESIAKTYPPVVPVDFPSLADKFTVVIEGAFIMGKSLNDAQIVRKQLQHYKQYLEMIFRQDS